MRTRERQPNVVFLGPQGTFTEEATRCFFGGLQIERTPCPSIPDVLDAVQSGQADYAVVPLENSIEGSVNLTMDWLIHRGDLQILGELVLPISQHLLAAQHLPLDRVEKVYSHPQAVAQCRVYLHQYLPHATIEYTSSTAEAVRLVTAYPEHPWVAIGTRLSQSIYGAAFLARDIEDHDNNCTRFVLVGSRLGDLQLHQDISEVKATYLITLPADFPGALHQVLAAFAWRKINLTRIESRPTKKALGSYHFIIDAEQNGEELLLSGAVAEIEALGCQVRALGTYPCYLCESME